MTFVFKATRAEAASTLGISPDRNRDLTEEIHYPNRCSVPGCIDDIIPSPDGLSTYCFKHYGYIDPDL